MGARQLREGPPARCGRGAGFTLLEVMAAVAVLGLITTYLVRASAQGASVEGEARRRLEASLLADRLLIELEDAWKAGAPLEMGRREQPSEGFQVVVDVAPFAPGDFGVAALLDDPPPPAGRRTSPLAGGPAALLAPPGARQTPALAVVTVVVSWKQGRQERAVTRTTFALDRQVASGLLEGVAAEQEAAEAAAAGGGGAGESRGLDAGASGGAIR